MCSSARLTTIFWQHSLCLDFYLNYKAISVAVYLLYFYVNSTTKGRIKKYKIRIESCAVPSHKLQATITVRYPSIPWQEHPNWKWFEMSAAHIIYNVMVCHEKPCLWLNTSPWIYYSGHHGKRRKNTVNAARNSNNNNNNSAHPRCLHTDTERDTDA